MVSGYWLLGIGYWLLVVIRLVLDEPMNINVINVDWILPLEAFEFQRLRTEEAKQQQPAAPLTPRHTARTPYTYQGTGHHGGATPALSIEYECQ